MRLGHCVLFFASMMKMPGAKHGRWGWAKIFALSLVLGFAGGISVSCSSDPGECRASGSVECCRWAAVDSDCPSNQTAWRCVGGSNTTDPSSVVGTPCVFTSTPSWTGYCCGL